MYKVQRAVCVNLEVSLKTPEKCVKKSIKGNEAGIIFSKVLFESDHKTQKPLCFCWLGPGSVAKEFSTRKCSTIKFQYIYKT